MVPLALLVIAVSIAANCGQGLDDNVTCLKHIAVAIVVVADQTGGIDAANAGVHLRGLDHVGASR